MSARVGDALLDAWLRKLGLEQPPPATSTGLEAAMRAQLQAIPFENIDVRCGHLPSLALDDLAAKLLARRRGGYCYELNTLLGAVLRRLGFTVEDRLARVMWNRPAPGPRSHQILVVTIDGQPLLADAGFGGPGLAAPLAIPPNSTAVSANPDHQLRHDETFGWVLERLGADGPEPLYAVRLDETVQADDFVVANHFSASYEGSLFKRNTLVAKMTRAGQVTLTNRQFRRHGTTSAECREIDDPTGYRRVLEEEFDIETGMLSDGDLRALMTAG